MNFNLHDINSEIIESLQKIYSPQESKAIAKKYLLYKCDLSLIDFLNAKKIKINLPKDFAEDLERLKNYEPLAYLMGYTYFGDCKILVNKNTLIPRPETEELADLIQRKLVSKKNLKVLDICTGSGCISIFLKKKNPTWSLEGFDLSQGAIEIAKKNSNINDTEIYFYVKDLFKIEKLEQKYDVIVSNPPYVLPREKVYMKKNVTDYEPNEAIFVSEDDPISFYKKIVSFYENLNDGGYMFLEINPMFAKELEELMIKFFKTVKIVKDFRFEERFIFCKKY